MARTRSAILVSVVLALAVPTGVAHAGAPAPTARVATSSAAAATTQVLASGLSIPWGIAGLPDGSALVTERNTGRIWQVKPGAKAKVVYTVTETRPAGEGGLLGIALASDYSRSRAFYVYYTTAVDNRVARIVLGSSARPKPIVTGIPKGTIHNGGGLYYKKNGYLYIGTGDTGHRALAQNTKSLAGKVLKVTSTGGAAPGNRWGRIFTIGHRNVQDMEFDPTGSRLYATELGQDSQDELNQLVNGRNYGWPVCEGRCNRSGYQDPIWTWHPSEASPSGITWVKTAIGPRFFVGALRGQRVWRINIQNGAVASISQRLVGTYGRIRGVQGRGDGSLWIMTSNGNGTDRVIRISPAP